MQKRYQIDKQRAVQQFRRLATETNPNIQMILPLAGIAGMLQEGVGHLMREAGLVLMMGVMEEEVPARGRRALGSERRSPGEPVGKRARLLRGRRAEGSDRADAGAR